MPSERVTAMQRRILDEECQFLIEAAHMFDEEPEMQLVCLLGSLEAASMVINRVVPPLLLV